MDRVDLKIGFACNNRCAFCVQGDKREREPPRPMEQIRADLEDGRRRGATGLVVTGGEPTVHSNVLDVIRLARKLGYTSIQVQTNGRRFHYDLFARAAVEAGATEFSPALHGSTERIHDGLTLSPGSFRQTVKGIENLVRLDQVVITNSVITSTNYTDLPALAELLVDLGVSQFQLAFVHILGSAEKNASWLVPRKWEVMPFVYRALDIGEAAGVRCMTEAIPYCLMEGYEDFVAEDVIPDTLIFDADNTIEDYGAYRRDEGKAKRPECAACRFTDRCEGPWREYTELFGFDEFKPMGALKQA